MYEFPFDIKISRSLKKTKNRTNRVISFNLNLDDPANFVPFGTMRYSHFDINLIKVHEHNSHMICILFVSE